MNGHVVERSRRLAGQARPTHAVPALSPDATAPQHKRHQRRERKMRNSGHAITLRSRAHRSVAVALLVMVVALVGASASNAKPPPSGPPDTYVASWDAVGSQAFTAAALSPAEGHTIFGYVAIAVYDSVMAVEGGYRPFAVKVDAPDGASAEAAVAAAAHRILVHYLPAQGTTILDPAYAASLATIPAGQAKTDGVAKGEEVAALFIAERAGDGFRAPVTYTPPSPPIPGVWLPTAPTPPIGTYLGLMEPFSLKSADQFRPAGPPALSSKRWAREYNEVKEIGSSTSTTRSAEQTLAARFWAEPPVQQARGSLRKFVLDHDLDIVQAARFMGNGLGGLRRRAHRVFQGQVPLRVLAADHRHPCR